jgi:hypothetical protein
MCLFGSVAHAQLNTLPKMKDKAIADCIAGRLGRPPASPELRHQFPECLTLKCRLENGLLEFCTLGQVS